MQVIVYATFIAFAVGAGVPVLGHFFNRPELVAHSTALWLMLGGVWIRSSAETVYYILFAQHQDKAIWLGNLLFLIPAFGGNALLVPFCGLNGIGYSAILSSGCLLAWRLWYVMHPDKIHDGSLPNTPDALSENAE